MTVNDLIVAAPWITFGAGLSAVCIRLLRSGRTPRPQPGRSRTPSSDPAAPAEPHPGGRSQAGLPAAPRRGSEGEETASRPYPKEARCCEKNA